MDSTTRLRILLANIVADAGAVRDLTANELADDSDRAYLTREVDRLQAAAHRMIAFLDAGVIDGRRH